MSVNLKGRKSAKSDQADAPAPQELVMAGAQTPWATEQSSGSPFAEQGMPPGMPSLPPPPPPYAPGEEPAEAEAGGKKSPFSKPMVIALAAVIALGGGGYYYLNMGSGSSTPAPKAHALTPAQLAALRARAAASAKAGAAGAAAKPTTAVIKPGTTAKAVVPPAKTVVPPAKTVVAPAKGATTKAAPGTTKSSTESSPTAVYTAALPGAINGWDKQVVAKAPATLATFDTVLGASITGFQFGVFGGTAVDPYLVVETGDHSKNPTAKAMDLIKVELARDRVLGLAVSKPFFVPHTPWGGSAACATTSATNHLTGNDESEVVCTWVDTNTFGVIAAPHRIAAQAPALLNSIRSQVEHGA